MNPRHARAPPFTPVVLNVRAGDSAVQLAVTFEAVLEVDQNQAVLAHARANMLEELKDALLRDAEGFLRTKITLHQLLPD